VRRGSVLIIPRLLLWCVEGNSRGIVEVDFGNDPAGFFMASRDDATAIEAVFSCSFLGSIALSWL
jgi:hypothetical protein